MSISESWARLLETDYFFHSAIEQDYFFQLKSEQGIFFRKNSKPLPPPIEYQMDRFLLLGTLVTSYCPIFDFYLYVYMNGKQIES